jgi:hypothetical protein
MKTVNTAKGMATSFTAIGSSAAKIEENVRNIFGDELVGVTVMLCA